MIRSASYDSKRPPPGAALLLLLLHQRAAHRRELASCPPCRSPCPLLPSSSPRRRRPAWPSSQPRAGPCVCGPCSGEFGSSTASQCPTRATCMIQTRPQNFKSTSALPCAAPGLPGCNGAMRFEDGRAPCERRPLLPRWRASTGQHDKNTQQPTCAIVGRGGGCDDAVGVREGGCVVVVVRGGEG